MFVGNLVEKSQPAVEPSMLESLPAKLLNDGCCRCLLAFASVRDVLHKSSRSFLYHLDLVDVHLSVKSQILEQYSNFGRIADLYAFSLMF